MLPSPEQIRESQLAEAARLRKKYDDEAAERALNGIPFSEIDVDDVVTVANRVEPDEWYRFKVAGIRHGRDTSKPGDPEVWAFVDAASGQFPRQYPNDIYKVVDKRKAVDRHGK